MYRKVSVEIEGEKPVSCASPGDLAIHKGAFAVLESRGVEEFGKFIENKQYAFREALLQLAESFTPILSRFDTQLF